MTSVTIEQAQANLPRLIEELTPGEEVVNTRRGQPWGCPAHGPRVDSGHHG